MKEVDEGKARAIAMKAIEDFQASTEFLAMKTATTIKAVEDFRTSMELEDEKADFAVATFKEAIRLFMDKVMARCPGVYPSFLDELLVPGEYSATVEVCEGSSSPFVAP